MFPLVDGVYHTTNCHSNIPTYLGDKTQKGVSGTSLEFPLMNLP